jgi:hypothetical protein
MLVGNKVDMAKREVSLPDGEEMARILGCKFVEASAKVGTNVEEAFYTIVRQLQQLREEKALLNDLLDSLPRWQNLLDNLEDKILLSQIELAKADRRTPVPVPAMSVATELPDAKILSSPQLPHLVPRQRSFPGINSCQPPSGPQSLPVSRKRKASSVGDTSQPSEHSDRLVLEGNYNTGVQNAFRDIFDFISTFGTRIGRLTRARHAENIARLKAATGNGMSTVKIAKSQKQGSFEIKGMPTFQMALEKCQNLCIEASFQVIRHGESADKIQEMKNEFARMIETADVPQKGLAIRLRGLPPLHDPSSITMVLRLAARSDVDAITQIALKARPLEPAFCYRYPKPHLEHTRNRYTEWLSAADTPSYDFLVVQAPSIEDPEVMKVISFSIWRVLQNPGHDDGAICSYPYLHSQFFYLHRSA